MAHRAQDLVARAPLTRMRFATRSGSSTRGQPHPSVRWSRLVPLTLVAVIGVCTGASGAEERAVPGRVGTSVPDQVAQQLDSNVSALARTGDFRGVVVIARGDSVLFRGTYSTPGEKPGVAGAAMERFPIASLTKTFTAAAVLLLVDRRQLALGDPVSRYVPDFPQANRITIEMLLTHRSGLPNEATFPDFVSRLNEPLTLQESIQRLAARPLDFEPGTNVAYSNSGYMLLAYVVERVSGVPFHQFVDSAILAPLHLREIEPVTSAARAGRLAPGFFVGPPPRFTVPVPRIEFSHAIGSGSLSASAEGLYHWARAAMQGQLLTVRTRPFGWSVNQRLGMRTYEQTGNLPGYLAAIMWFEPEDLYVVFLSSVQSGTAFFRAPTALASIALGPRTTHRLSTGSPRSPRASPAPPLATMPTERVAR